ncbi:DNA topoisomerase-3 [Kineothrix alysoides]|uniref:DNA topoisomerase n=1 Tax=Kineothrix alysoides TaxID=1469948 RepID=A0A4R1QZL3_9FIRM|nr:DNA topoisomerase [Kineothrix alysoides]TCL58436.1 DNA topoisomerase-3 [Kineothrix alysoides]
MGKSLYIAEKPSVAREFAKALKLNMSNKDGYMESEEAIVTWCVGHLVTMSYPEVYDEKYKRWSLATLPFIPEEFKYEVIENVKKQFTIVSGLLNRAEVDTIYVCTDSGREGEYIYRLVEKQAGVSGKQRKRVWIDSQTEEEILRGIREAKDLSSYDNLCSAAYLRAKEDYLMGINFSRVLTLKYSNSIKSYLKTDKAVVSVGRVMTCVLGMVVNREREIRNFVKTSFYRVIAGVETEEKCFECEWKAVEGTKYYNSPLLYKENGFKEKKTAQELIDALEEAPGAVPVIESVEKKKETKNPPLLYNLAELQNDCSKYFKISPDETLRIVQELYEKKMTTYPRTDARVLSTAVAKEISKNISGLKGYSQTAAFVEEVLQKGTYKNIAKTRYVNDKQITDHYAIIPTGQGLGNLGSLSSTAAKVYEIIVRRFLCIFFPAAVYQKIALTIGMKEEKFFASFKVLVDPGYLKATEFSFAKKKEESNKAPESKETEAKEAGAEDGEGQEEGNGNDTKDPEFMEMLKRLKKGDELSLKGFEIKEGETSPPKRYNSGTMILTMENAGQFIEDEELRAQMKGSGIGTSATRAEILKKLVNIEYLSLNKKTQIITPALMGEMIYDVVAGSIRPLLDPALTASWEKGLTLVAEGSITEDEYMRKLDDFVTRRTNSVKQMENQSTLYMQFDMAAKNYKK